jgi:hypothetical protein
MGAGLSQDNHLEAGSSLEVVVVGLMALFTWEWETDYRRMT